MRYLEELDGIENMIEPDKVQEVVEATEEEWMTEEESRHVGEGGDLDPDKVRRGGYQDVGDV